MPKFMEIAVPIPLLLAALGCTASDDRQPVYPVVGKATCQGEPMAGARITFHPLQASRPRPVRAMAEVDSDGRFSMTTYVTADGAPVGEHAVTIYWPGPRLTEEPGDDPDLPADDLPPDRLKRVHASPKTTRLRAVVREQPNTIDFHLP